MKLREFLLERFTQAELDSLVALTPIVAPPVSVDCVRSDVTWANDGPEVTHADGSVWQPQIGTFTVLTPAQGDGMPCDLTPITREVFVSAAPPSALVLVALPAKINNRDYSAGGPDQVDVSNLPPPIPWDTFVDSQHTIAKSANGNRNARFRRLPVYGWMNTLYHPVPGLIDVNGAPQIIQVLGQFGSDPVLNIRHRLADWGAGDPLFPHIPYPTRPGPRGQAIMTPYTTWHGHTRKDDNGVVIDSPNIPFVIGLTMDGKMQYGMRDGSVIDAGHLPVAADSYTNDFTFYFPDRKLFFYTESRHGKIIKVDRHTTPWTITEFATGLGADVSSVRAIGTKLYAAVHSTGNVWEIDVPTGAKRIVCTIPFAFWVDYTSTGQLVVATTAWTVHIVDAVTGSIGANLTGIQLNGSTPWVQMDIDRNGTCGPVDTIYFIPSNSNGNIDFYRLFPVAGGYDVVLGGLGGSGVMASGDSWYVQDPIGHYPWTVAVHPDEGVLFVQGFASMQLGVLGVMDPSDPFPASYPYDHILMANGRAMIGHGGTAAQVGSVPSFTCVMGWDCDSYLGCTSDYMAAMSYAELAAFIRGGMIGSVPRTLTNADLWPLGAYILGNSQKHLKEGRAVIDGWRSFLGV